VDPGRRSSVVIVTSGWVSSGASRVVTGAGSVGAYRRAAGPPRRSVRATSYRGPVAAPAPLPSGVGVALVTFFDDRGAVDARATAARARRCADLGVASVLVAGTTGEAARLSVRDRVELAAAVKSAVPEVPVIVGTGFPDATSALEASAQVAAGVADALLVYCPQAEEPAAFYGKVREESRGRPVIAYHNPALAARELGTAEVPTWGVDGIKDSSHRTDRLAELLELQVRVYVGSPTQLALAGPCGAAGALLALANVAPTDCIAAFGGDVAAQRRLLALHRQVVEEPGSLKRAEPR